MNVTALLRRWQAGDARALDELGPLLHAELHRIAAAYTRAERPGLTLTPTELVHEAFVRLVGADVPWNDRVHFFAAAAQHMRRILVDHARKRVAEKRGGGVRPEAFDDGLVGGERPAALIALDAALTALAQHDERRARVVQLHYFGGMTHDEVATALGVHLNTVARDLRLATAWLTREMEND